MTQQITGKKSKGNSRKGLILIFARRVRAQPLSATLRKMRNPSVLRRQLRRLLAGDADGISNLYRPSFSRAEELSFTAEITSADISDVERIFVEIESSEFMKGVAQRYAEIRHRNDLQVHRFRIWYAIVRILRPANVVETGVHDGLSSAVLLYALQQNAVGQLTSIDLPATDLPIGVSGPGWLVPADLAPGWDLRLGDAKALLPRLADELTNIDLFIHDSDHSTEHQTFEYETVLPKMSAKGIILSDQDYPHETALPTIARRLNVRHARVQTAGDPVRCFAGAIALGQSSRIEI